MWLREGLRLALVLVSFGGAAMAQNQAPILKVSGTGGIGGCWWNYYYGCTWNYDPFTLDRAHQTAPDNPNFRVGAALGSASALVTIEGEVGFGPNPSECGGCTLGWGANVTLEVSVLGSPGVAYDLDIVKSAIVVASTSSPYGYLSALSDIGSHDTRNPQQNTTYRSVNTIHGTTSGQITSTISMGATIYRHTGCPSYSGWTGECWPYDEPGYGNARVFYTVSIVARRSDAVNTLLLRSVNGQTGNLNQPLPSPLVVEVRDQNGFPAEGVPVAYEITAPAGAQGQSLSRTSDFTANGLSSTEVVLGDKPGEYQVTASCACTPSSVAFTVRTPLEVKMFDPVPTLLDFSNPSGAAVISDPVSLTNLVGQSREVLGVAADGVAQVVVQIKGAAPNEQLSVSVGSDGALAALGTAFSTGDIAVTADGQGNAFALYQAPVDFVRQPADAFVAYRLNTLRVASLQNPSLTLDKTMTVVRPMVMIIHGVWSSYDQTWGQFTPFVNDVRFTLARGEFNDIVEDEVDHWDPYDLSLLLIKANAMGLDYNWPPVRGQLVDALDVFRKRGNRAGVDIAAVQADLVGHSMGGLIARKVSRETFYSSVYSNFGKGLIHKLITIDTPHLGSPVAKDLLDDQNKCTRRLFAFLGSPALKMVRFSNGDSFPGAIADLKGDGTPSENLSDALRELRSPNQPPIPTAMIAGIAGPDNMRALDSSLATLLIVGTCPGDPLAQRLWSGGWHTEFPLELGGANDGLVGENSQLNGLGVGFVFGLAGGTSGYIHSPGTKSLGFAGPTVLDPAPDPTCSDPAKSVPCRVADLLNKAVSDLQQLYP